MKYLALFIGGFNIGATVHTLVNSTFDFSDGLRGTIGILLIGYFLYIDYQERHQESALQ